MIGFRACAGAVLLSLLLGSVVQADIEKFSATNLGWCGRYATDDDNNPYEYSSGFSSYLAGRYTTGGHTWECRNFFVFDLSTLDLADKNLDSVTLKIDTGGIAGGSLAYKLFATSVSDLLSLSNPPDDNPPDLAKIFADLGDGTSYGSYDISAPNTVVSIVLSSDLIAAVAENGKVAVGGAMTALTPNSSDNQYAFGYVDGIGSPHLWVETSIVIPEPGTFVLLFMGAASLLAFSRRRQSRRPR